MKCPRCGSTHISQREVGMRSCATTGGLVGAAVGVNSALRGAQIGVSLGAFAGPLGSAAGGLGGAVIAAICSGSAGCAIGSTAGKLLDATVLDNRSCMTCGLTFREGTQAAAVEVSVTSVHSGSPAPGSQGMGDAPRGFFTPQEE